MKTVLYLPDTYLADIHSADLSKLVTDLVGKKLSKRSSSSTRFIILMFSTRYFNSNYANRSRVVA